MKVLRQLQEETPRVLARERIRRMIATGGYRRGDQLPTYEVLCERLGVSLLTVQRAMGDLAKQGLVRRLHGKGCYVGKTVELGPRPFSQVGIVYSASMHRLIREPYLNLMLTGLLDGCTARNVDLTILSLKTARGPISPTQLCAQVDAVVLLNVTDPDYVRAFVDTHAPLVQLDNYAPSVPTDAVLVDNAAAVQAVMRHLIGLGHRRIAYLAGGTSDPFKNAIVESSDGQERRAAYLAEMRRAGLEAEVRILESAKMQAGDAVAMIRAANPPTAFVTYGAPAAAELCRQLTAAGLRVPQDVSVAGDVGSETDAVVDGLSIAHSQGDFYTMGAAAIEILARRCRQAKPPAKPTIRRIPVKFVPGLSTAAPPA
jgi:DNA-binding LacI/PurR family transcriptional regulator